MGVNRSGGGASNGLEEKNSRATESPDADLVERARAGDHDAFRRLVERHQRASYALAIGMLRHEADARDALQEAFLKAYRNLASFQGNAAFSTWLYRIVTNACIDRRRRRKITVEADDATIGAVDSSPTLAVMPRNPHRELERIHLGERIHEALGKLPEHHRDAIVLRELEGLSYAEIAVATGVSIGTVMSRLFNARQKLQLALADVAEAAQLRPSRGSAAAVGPESREGTASTASAGPASPGGEERA